MKNLIHLGVEYIDSLPVDTLSLHLQKKHKKDHYSHRSYENHSVNGEYPWKHVRRICEKFVGKPVNEAFTKYCEIVPKYQQKEFWKDLKEHVVYSWKYNHYKIDENGLIQYAGNPNKYKGPYTFRSEDCKIEKRHSVTGHKLSDFEEVYEKIPYERKRTGRKMENGKYYTWIDKGCTNGKFLYYEYGTNPFSMKPIYQRYKAQSKDFEYYIIQGYTESFDSKQDPRFKRLTNERRKKKEVSRRQQRKIDQEKAYSYISKSELEEKKEKETNKYKILAHGFDLETSFRTEKQTNPDLIKFKQ